MWSDTDDDLFKSMDVAVTESADQGQNMIHQTADNNKTNRSDHNEDNETKMSDHNEDTECNEPKQRVTSVKRIFLFQSGHEKHKNSSK